MTKLLQLLHTRITSRRRRGTTFPFQQLPINRTSFTLEKLNHRASIIVPVTVSTYPPRIPLNIHQPFRSNQFFFSFSPTPLSKFPPPLFQRARSIVRSRPARSSSRSFHATRKASKRGGVARPPVPAYRSRSLNYLNRSGTRIIVVTRYTRLSIVCSLASGAR